MINVVGTLDFIFSMHFEVRITIFIESYIVNCRKLRVTISQLCLMEMSNFWI